MTNEELYHHGILGQKWGVRRYQNPDGTLTPAGKERYGHDISRQKKKRLNKQIYDLVSSDKAKNFNSVDKKVADEARKTKEGKSFTEAEKFLNTILSEAQSKGIGSNQLLIDGSVAKPYIAAQNAYNAKVKEIGKKYVNQYALATLKDLGYELNDKNISYMSNKFLKEIL